MSALIGIFGGTFDPIHNGHLRSVEQLSQLIELDRVHWVLSAQPPHKNSTNCTSAQRFRMLQLALGSSDRFIADDIEILRDAKSYTVDTVEQFSVKYPSDRLVLIIGGDSMQQLMSWHRIEELLDMVNWVVLHRPGFDFSVPKALQQRIVTDHHQILDGTGSIWLFEDSNTDISSTQIRRQLATPGGYDSELLKQHVPSAVLAYIRDQQLYKIPFMNSEQLKDQVVEALDNIKGQDINVIDIADISDFADYMVVASGTSDTHVKALAREASDHLRKQGVKPLNEDGADVGEWVLVDFGDVVLHVMRPEVREYYDLEKLWDEDVRNLVKQHREQQED